MSCMENIVKFTHKNAKAFNISVEFRIRCLQCVPCLTSVYCALLYSRPRVPVDFLCLLDI